ncbi:MAG: hypothetical protein WBB23_13060 [Desulforhopalus sp.]
MGDLRGDIGLGLKRPTGLLMDIVFQCCHGLLGLVEIGQPAVSGGEFFYCAAQLDAVGRCLTTELRATVVFSSYTGGSLFFQAWFGLRLIMLLDREVVCGINCHCHLFFLLEPVIQASLPLVVGMGPGTALAGSLAVYYFSAAAPLFFSALLHKNRLKKQENEKCF